MPLTHSISCARNAFCTIFSIRENSFDSPRCSSVNVALKNLLTLLGKINFSSLWVPMIICAYLYLNINHIIVWLFNGSCVWILYWITSISYPSLYLGSTDKWIISWLFSLLFYLSWGHMLYLSSLPFWWYKIRDFLSGKCTILPQKPKAKMRE